MISSHTTVIRLAASDKIFFDNDLVQNRKHLIGCYGQGSIPAWSKFLGKFDI